MRPTARVSVLLTQALFTSSHYWPQGYNRHSRGRTWGASSQGSGSYSRVSRQNSPPPQLFSPPQQPYSYPSQQLYSSPQQQPQQLYSSPSQQPQQLYSSPAQQPQQLYSSPAQQPPQLYNSPSSQQSVVRDFSQPRSSVKQRNWPVKGDSFPSYADRCGSCRGQPEAQVCGSDGKTYKNSCELTYISCKKYWDLREVSKGPCAQDCPGVELGMYTGWGLSRASNKGYCHHDFFRCCKAARSSGLAVSQVRSCCQARADKCFAFVAEKPWRSGIAKYGK